MPIEMPLKAGEGASGQGEEALLLPLPETQPCFVRHTKSVWEATQSFEVSWIEGCRSTGTGTFSPMDQIVNNSCNHSHTQPHLLQDPRDS